MTSDTSEIQAVPGKDEVSAPSAAAVLEVSTRTPWRTNIEAALMAVVMALFLKHFVIEAYKIPSGSMQPTLMGDVEAGIEDRILVDKLSYVVREPRRWEVAVFRYPLDRSKSFVKRIAGIGPEELRILYGDVWHREDGGWRVLRRPPQAQASAWRKLDVEDAEQSHWIPELPASSRWSTNGRSISARGPGTAAFRGGHESIADDYLDGYPESLLPWLPAYRSSGGENEVGDVRVEGTIRALAGTERFTVVLREGERRYRFVLPGPAAPADARALVDAGPSARAGTSTGLPYRLPVGRAVRFAAENLDDRLALELDGVEVLAQEIEAAEDQFSTAVLQLEGEGAELEDLMVSRDLYYTSEGDETIRVPAGSYYMLGDNTRDSSDSREWRYVVYDVADADGGRTRVRGNARSGENPRTLHGAGPDGPLTYLVDEWGEKHWFASDRGTQLTPEAAPFVPREMIQGRALAVFWPLQPLRGVWRLEWVN